MKIIGILTAIPVLLASNLSDASPSVLLSSILPTNTPLMDSVCNFHSKALKNYTKDKVLEYQCFCKDMDSRLKPIFEGNIKFMLELKKEKSPFLKDISAVFTEIFKYLEKELKNQNQYIDFVNFKVDFFPAEANVEIILFILRNEQIPIEKFYWKYSEFLIKLILDKYEEQLKKLERMNISNVFKIELFFMKCRAKYANDNGEFKDVFDAAKFIHKRVLDVFKVLSRL